MWACYALVKNFGWAIILFTLIIKAVMFPLNLKQQKNQALSQMFMPRVKEIQTKYRNNPEKQQEELTKLQKEGYNPTGGCGTMLITFLILFGVIDVVYKPMTHMEHFKTEEINAVVTTAEQIDIAKTILANPEDAAAVLEFRTDAGSIAFVETTDENGTKTNNRITTDADFKLDEAKNSVTVSAEELATYGVFTEDELNTLIKSSRLSDVVRNNINLIHSSYYNSSSLYRELRALKIFEDETTRPLFEANPGISSELIGRVAVLDEHMHFGPINLLDQPTWAFNSLIIIPVIAFVFSLAQSLVMMVLMKKQNPELNASQPASAKAIYFITPFISLWISFSVPAGAGFYWAVSYLFGILQSLITYKFWPSDKIRAEAKAKMEAAAAQKEQKATIVEIDADGNKTERTNRLSELSQKEIKELNRKKLEAARKADAEKYGEEYTESPEDDDF